MKQISPKTKQFSKEVEINGKKVLIAFDVLGSYEYHTGKCCWNTDLSKIYEEAYSYETAVLDDVCEYLEENLSASEWTILASTNECEIEELEEKYREEMWTADSITGNASGSYWFSTYNAELALVSNSELLEEARDDFGSVPDDAEGRDVSIRCYLLHRAVAEAFRLIQNAIEAAFNK